MPSSPLPVDRPVAPLTGVAVGLSVVQLLGCLLGNLAAFALDEPFGFGPDVVDPAFLHGALLVVTVALGIGALLAARGWTTAVLALAAAGSLAYSGTLVILVRGTDADVATPAVYAVIPAVVLVLLAVVGLRDR